MRREFDEMADRFEDALDEVHAKLAGAPESEEKREPASDIDTGVVDSLKVLDPDGRLEKRTNG
jgi:hypothetical protein